MAENVGFHEVLEKHGVEMPYEYAVCTNEIYKPLLGGTAKEIKQQRGVSDLRNGLSRVELMAVGLAEALASEKIEKTNADGFSKCRNICTDSSKRVNRVFE